MTTQLLLTIAVNAAAIVLMCVLNACAKYSE
jgi:hypothetical protein